MYTDERPSPQSKANENINILKLASSNINVK